MAHAEAHLGHPIQQGPSGAQLGRPRRRPGRAADAPEGDAGKVGGFSLHAGVAAEAHERQKLKRLCRYITRPAISEKRLSLSPQGRVRYQLKTPWRNGTTHGDFEPVEFIAKLAVLVPPPRAHLTRFRGVFAPNANLRAQLTPSGRGKRPPADVASTAASSDRRSPDEKRRSMTWAQRLTRIFNIDVRAAATVAARCGSWPASKNPPRSAPSSPTSLSTARWRKRTTGRQRAHRPLWPRDTPRATTPKA